MEYIIEAKNVKKCFDDLEVLKDISLTVSKGEVISIIGSSGSGKSTFLRCLNKLEYIDSGDILIDGVSLYHKNTNINKLRAKMGMVFQSFNLFNNMNVLDNCVLAQRKVLKRNKNEAVQIALQNLEKVGLLDKKDYKVSQLSGGQKQRVAIARALSMNPEVVLFDEPTSALDPEMVNEVLETIKKLKEDGLTMIIVTHQMSFARDISTKVIFMDKGIVEDEGTPEYIFEKTTNQRLQEFLGKSN